MVIFLFVRYRFGVQRAPLTDYFILVNAKSDKCRKLGENRVSGAECALTEIKVSCDVATLGIWQRWQTWIIREMSKVKQQRLDEHKDMLKKC